MYVSFRLKTWYVKEKKANNGSESLETYVRLGRSKYTLNYG